LCLNLGFNFMKRLFMVLMTLVSVSLNAASPSFSSFDTDYFAVTGTTVKLATSPLISSFADATHTHQNAAGGGTLDTAAIASGTLALDRGGTGSSLVDPNADRIAFWDDSAGAVEWLTVGSGLSITDTTITATGGSAPTFNSAQLPSVGGTTNIADGVPLTNAVNYEATSFRAAGNNKTPMKVFGDDNQSADIAIFGQNDEANVFSVSQFGIYLQDKGSLAGTPSFMEGSIWREGGDNSLNMYLGGITNTFVTSIYIATNAAGQTITNDTTETTMFPAGVGTQTLPADYWKPGKSILLYMAGNYWTPAVNTTTLTIRVKYGTTTGASVVVPAFPTSQTAAAFSGRVILTCCSIDGATATFMITGEALYDVTISGNNLPAKSNLDNGGATFTADVNASKTLDVTGDFSASTSGLSVRTMNAGIVPIR
jgi:hypothetical protein